MKELVIWGGTALTMDAHGTIIEDAVLTVKNGMFSSIQSNAKYKPVKGIKHVNAKGGLITPGLVNCHTHAAMSFLRGIAEDRPLESWLRDVIFPLEQAFGSPSFVYEGTLLSCVEMIRSGTTLFNDMYFFEEWAAKAAHEAGLRAVCGQTLIETDHVTGASSVLEEFDAYLEKIAPLSGIYPALAPHAVYSVSQNLLEKLIAYAEAHRLPIHIHVAEKQQEVVDCIARTGKTPVQYLDELGLWSQKVIAAHSVCLNAEDIKIYGRKKVGVAHNPESNLKLGTDICPVKALREAGAIVGLGTDSAASNNNLDLFQEADFAAKLQSLKYGPGSLTAEAAGRLMTCEGARALGLEKITGSLELGKAADLIVIDTHQAHALPLHNPYAHMVYGASGQDVLHSVIAGRVVLEEKKILTLDEDAILDNATRWGQKISGRAAAAVLDQGRKKRRHASR